MRRLRHAIAALGLSLVCLGAPARADRDAGQTQFVVGVLVESPLMVTQLVTSIANASYIAAGDRAPAGWVGVGCAAGALGVLIGTYTIATNTSSTSTAALFGVPTIALGLTSVVLGVWAGASGRRPRAAPLETIGTRVMFTPTLALDVARREVPSVGLTVVF